IARPCGSSREDVSRASDPRFLDSSFGRSVPDDGHQRAVEEESLDEARLLRVANRPRAQAPARDDEVLAEIEVLAVAADLRSPPPAAAPRVADQIAFEVDVDEHVATESRRVFGAARKIDGATPTVAGTTEERVQKRRRDGNARTDRRGGDVGLHERAGLGV